MSLFRCDTCGCYENTACSNYWARQLKTPVPPAECSECDPEIGEWHGRFPKESAEGLLVGDDGFLWKQQMFERRLVVHTKPIARIVDGKAVPLTADEQAQLLKMARA